MPHCTGASCKTRAGRSASRARSAFSGKIPAIRAYERDARASSRVLRARTARCAPCAGARYEGVIREHRIHRPAGYRRRLRSPVRAAHRAPAVRDLHVYSEIVPCDIAAEEVRALAPAAIILSGGPASVYAEDAPSLDPEIFELGIPVLGFCYGQQIMAVTLGGEVGHTEKGEYGPAPLTRLDGRDGTAPSLLYGGTPTEQTVWMSHRDAVSRVPEALRLTAATDVLPRGLDGMPRARRLYATQFPSRGAPHRLRRRSAGRTSCSASAALSRRGRWTRSSTTPWRRYARR